MGWSAPSPRLILMGQSSMAKGEANDHPQQTPRCRRVRRRSGQEPLPCLRSRCGRRTDPAGDISTGHATAILRARDADDCRHGGVPRLAVAGAQAPDDGPHGSDRAGKVREALCEEQQERSDRCGSHRRGSVPANDALRRGEVTRAGRPASLAPGARSPCRPAHPRHLPDESFLPRVRDSDASGRRQVQSRPSSGAR